jgi:hypothetical protein
MLRSRLRGIHSMAAAHAVALHSGNPYSGSMAWRAWQARCSPERGVVQLSAANLATRVCKHMSSL